MGKGWSGRGQGACSSPDWASPWFPSTHRNRGLATAHSAPPATHRRPQMSQLLAGPPSSKKCLCLLLLGGPGPAFAAVWRLCLTPGMTLEAACCMALCTGCPGTRGQMGCPGLGAIDSGVLSKQLRPGVIPGKTSDLSSSNRRQREEVGLLRPKLAGHPSLRPARISTFISSMQLELKRGGPEEWLVTRGPRSHAGEQGAFFFCTEATGRRAGPVICGPVSQNPQGAIREHAHVPSPGHLLPLKGISFPLLFSTVAVGSQVLRTQLENGLLPNSPSEWSGEIPGLETDSLSQGNRLTEHPFFISKSRQRSSLICSS